MDQVNNLINLSLIEVQQELLIIQNKKYNKLKKKMK